ncbi:MAG: hypothetical protein ACRD0Z_00645 [Acidimicrobiales bacterium]
MNWRIAVSILLIIVGLLGLAVGLMYISIAPHNLPMWFPGHISKPHALAHKKRGEAGIVVGAVILIVGIGVAMSARRGSHRHRRHSW